MLLLQGDEDRVVSAACTRELADALRRAGATVELQVYKGEGHGWKRAATVADELARVAVVPLPLVLIAEVSTC